MKVPWCGAGLAFILGVILSYPVAAQVFQRTPKGRQPSSAGIPTTGSIKGKLTWDYTLISGQPLITKS